MDHDKEVKKDDDLEEDKNYAKDVQQHLENVIGEE
jgi:hypothetical protein